MYVLTLETTIHSKLSGLVLISPQSVNDSMPWTSVGSGVYFLFCYLFPTAFYLEHDIKQCGLGNVFT